MKTFHWVILFVVVAAAATLANLLALKIAADQVSGSVGSSPLLGLIGGLKK